MSTDRRLPISDNLGWQPCLDPVVLGRALDRLDQGRGLTLRDRVAKALAQLRRRLAR
jgi:hypothetical protein